MEAETAIPKAPKLIGAMQGAKVVGVSQATFYRLRKEGAWRVVDGEVQHRKLEDLCRDRSPSGTQPGWRVKDLVEFREWLEENEPYLPEEK